MKSLAAELCLFLARKLEPGSGKRDALVERGLLMSSIANKRLLGANGKVKYTLAYEVHQPIHLELLSLSTEDCTCSRESMFCQEENAKLSTSSSSGSRNQTKQESADFAKHLTVRGDNSTGSCNNAPSQVSIDSKKRGALNKMSSLGHNSESGSQSKKVPDSPKLT